MEYEDGGILDPDDMLTDLVEDKDKVSLPWYLYTNTRAGLKSFYLL